MKLSSPNSELPIGVFDSGLGGLTVARQLVRCLPHEDFVYLGDTARVPYGNKSPSTVTRFSGEAARFLVDQKVKAIVIACNTASAWALPQLQADFAVPLFGVIAPGAAAALKQLSARRIGIIATAATIRSGAYTRAIRTHQPLAQVFGQACPLLVPLVEEGWENHPAALMILRKYLAPLLRRKIDTLVLGCTHYPLLRRAIRRCIPKDVALVDSAQACAIDVATQLSQLNRLARGRRRWGTFRTFVTDESPQFSVLAARLFKSTTGKPVVVSLP